MPNQQPAAPQQMPFGPVPTAYAVAVAQLPDGTSQVMIQFQTQQGMNVFFFAPENIPAFIESLLDASRTAKTGLIIPTPQVPPDLNGLGGPR